MSDHPEAVARELTTALNGYGYHDKKHAEIEMEPTPGLRVYTEFADNDTERSVILRKIGGVARKRGFFLYTYDFEEECAVLYEDS